MKCLSIAAGPLWFEISESAVAGRAPDAVEVIARMVIAQASVSGASTHATVNVRRLCVISDPLV